jgi:hypothetical protein
LFKQKKSNMANGHGGVRKGQGRKPLALELNTSQLARETLISKFGSLNNALQALWDSEEPTLMKFVAEHAFGKAVEKTAQTDTDGNDLPNVTINGK